MIKFKKGDLIIAKPENDSNRDSGTAEFDSYARVIGIDRMNNVLKIDRYRAMGRIHLHSDEIPVDLKRAEEKIFRPMQESEVKEFQVGLAALCRSPRFRSMAEHERQQINATFEAANNALRKDVMGSSVKIKIFPDMGDSFSMMFDVPEDRDVEEYVEEQLDRILSKDFRYSSWEFSG